MTNSSANGQDQRQEWIRCRRKKRKGAKSARLRRQLFRYLVLLTMLLGGVYVLQRMPWTLTDQEKDIIIAGNQATSDRQIRQVISPYLHKPIYAMDPKELEKRISSLPAVKYAFVRRWALPEPKLMIEILEEYPWATFYTDPEDQPKAVIAQSGRMIPIDEFPNMLQPSLKIYGPTNLKLSVDDVSQWDSWVKYVAEQTKQPVESVDLRVPFDVRLKDADLCLKLGTPDATLGRRLARLTSVMPAIASWRGKLEYIDLGLDNNIPLKVAKKTDWPKGLIN